MYKKILKFEWNELKTEAELIEYEKKFYEACTSKGTDRWALDNLLVIDGCRLKPFVPYDKLISIGLKINDELVSGVRVNTDVNNFQIYKAGFKIDINENVCEGINFFTLADDFHPLEFFNIIEKFMNDCMSKIKYYGYKHIYASCIDKIKIIYIRAGFKIMDSKIINGELAHLIRYDF